MVNFASAIPTPTPQSGFFFLKKYFYSSFIPSLEKESPLFIENNGQIKIFKKMVVEGLEQGKFFFKT